MTTRDVRPDTNGLLSLNDFRPAFGVGSGGVGAPPAAHMAALSSFWESCIRAEGATETSAAGFNYPSAYEAVFDRVPQGTPVAFRDFPIGLQRLVGGRATEVWYACAEIPGAVDLPRNVQALAGSSWTRRTVRVRDLAAHVLTEWAVDHVWPCGPHGEGFFGIPPVEFTGGYTRLMRNQRFDAPVIFLDGEIHVHAVAYTLALLRFAPDATVRVLEGVSAIGGATTKPVAPRWAWRADGTALWDPTQAGDHEMAPDAVGRMDRLVLTGHAPAIVALGSAFGLGGANGTSQEDAVVALRDALLTASLPYLESSVASTVPHDQRPAWRQPSIAVRPVRNGGIGTWIVRTLGRLLDRTETDSADRSAYGKWTAQRAEAERRRIVSSPLRPFLPELVGEA